MNRPCRQAGCPAVVPKPGRYCVDHAAEGARRDAEKTNAYDRLGRHPEAKAFYNSAAWKQARAIVLAEQPVCAACGRDFSHHVDHVEPLLDAWDRRLDRTNLQGLCASCHSAKTATERARP